MEGKTYIDGKTGEWVCPDCGERVKMNLILPLRLDTATEFMKAFEKAHEKCSQMDEIKESFEKEKLVER